MNKSIISFGGIIILLFFIQSVIYSCPKCDQDFYNQLMGERGNTLGGQELLEAIQNQTIPGVPSSLVLPATYNSETDIKKTDMSDSTDAAIDDNNNYSGDSAIAGYFTYIITFVRLTFIEGF